MKYNSQLKKITLPEYGRHVQNMVDHCTNIADRDERNYCARSIVRIMANMFPQFKAENGNKDDIYWDHIALISNFELDIDYPCPITSKEKLQQRPEPVPYHDNDIIYRQYGHIIQELIKIACGLEPGDRRRALELSIAEQMKLSYMTSMHTAVTDYKIFKDLYELSSGQIELTEEEYILPTPTIDPQAEYSHRKKKRK